MIPQFVNEFEITFDIFKKWTRQPINKKVKQDKTKKLILFLFGLVVSIALILFGIFWPNSVAIFIGSLFVLLLFFRAAILPNMTLKKRYDQIITSQMNQPWIRSYSFADVIQVTDFQNHSEYKYSSLTGATEDNDYYYLWLNKGSVIRVMKSAFKKGTAKDFRGFIIGKIKKSRGEKKRT